MLNKHANNISNVITFEVINMILIPHVPGVDLLNFS